MARRTLMHHRSHVHLAAPFSRDTGDGGGGGGAVDISVRPDGVAEADWATLGDPGKAAIVRERNARQSADQTRQAAEQRATAAEQAKTSLEQQLAVLRAAQGQPGQQGQPGTGQQGQPSGQGQPGNGGQGQQGQQPDISQMIAQAVTAAMQPFQEAQAQRDATAAAVAIRDALVAAAGPRLHDPSDAVAHIDLTTLTDGNGQADAAKITAALDGLLTQRPHLGKVHYDPRRAPDGSLLGASLDTNASLDDRTKATLARMQASTGVKFAGQG